jgi:hypothetical protein
MTLVRVGTDLIGLNFVCNLKKIFYDYLYFLHRIHEIK